MVTAAPLPPGRADGWYLVVMEVFAVLAVTTIAYLVGAIPFAYVLGRLAGIDLRTAGSGNVGAGNLTRTAGVGFGAAAAILDGLKGLAAVVSAQRLGFGLGLAASAGVFAVAGHNWSVFLRGRAGRGLAPSVGVLVALAPGLLLWPGAWAVAGWFVGGGIAGFLGWGLLPVVAVAAAASGTIVSLTAALAMLMVARRAQGNAGRSDGLRAAVVRIISDRDPSESDQVPATT